MRTHLLTPVTFVFLLSATFNSSFAQQVAAGTPASSTKNESLQTLPSNVLDAELLSARGGPFRLSEYSGRVLVINLWATWLFPSRQETPELVKLQSHFWSQGVRVVGLSVENPETSRSAVRQWVRTLLVQYKIGWIPADAANTLMQGSEAIPQTFVISRTGRIVRRFVGYNPSNTPLQFRQAIEEALKEKVEAPDSAKPKQP